MAPDRIIISPGPGSPDDPRYFGICAEVIEKLGKTTPLLGVCLGMQGIVHVFGGKVVKAPLPMHGKISPINHNNQSVFNGVPDQLEVMRYHSLMAEAESFPECLQLTALVGDFPAREFDNLSRIRQGGDFAPAVGGVMRPGRVLSSVGLARRFSIVQLSVSPISFRLAVTPGDL